MRFACVALLLLAFGCPGPSPTPPPPTPPPPPGQVCEDGWFCDCWHRPPGEDWQEAVCPAGQTCMEHQCVTTPGPTPTPTVSPTATPTPTKVCPKELATGAKVYLVNKAYGSGWDSTVRVYGDPAFCNIIHGTPVNDCHLEGWPKRAECEESLLDHYRPGGGCPEWQYATDAAGPGAAICHDDHNALASCDHFGSVDYRDDPQTPTTGDTVETLKGFEGRPLACGLQRDEFGPRAGHYAVAHGKAYIRACPPASPLDAKSSGGPGNPSGPCGPWKAFDK